MAHEARDEIHLWLTDPVMPQMGGKELVDQFRTAYPGAKVLYTSEYTDEGVQRRSHLRAWFALLQKPFTPSSLTTKLREVLGQP